MYISIEKASNGFVVTFHGDEDSTVTIFTDLEEALDYAKEKLSGYCQG